MAGGNSPAMLAAGGQNASCCGQQGQDNGGLACESAAAGEAVGMACGTAKQGAIGQLGNGPDRKAASKDSKSTKRRSR